MTGKPNAIELIKEGHREGDRVVAMHVAWEAITSLTAEGERLRARAEKAEDLADREAERHLARINELEAVERKYAALVEAWRQYDQARDDMAMRGVTESHTDYYDMIGRVEQTYERIQALAQLKEKGGEK